MCGEAWYSMLHGTAWTHSAIMCAQEFVSHICDTSEMGASRFAVADVHRIGILDVRLYNTDRWAASYDRTIPCVRLHDALRCPLYNTLLNTFQGTLMRFRIDFHCRGSSHRLSVCASGKLTAVSIFPLQTRT